MKKQSSIDWLVEQLRMQNPLYTKEQIIEIAKEMHKEEIIEAHIKGHNAPSSTIKHFDAEQYYNETYKN